MAILFIMYFKVTFFADFRKNNKDIFVQCLSEEVETNLFWFKHDKIKFDFAFDILYIFTVSALSYKGTDSDTNLTPL